MLSFVSLGILEMLTKFFIAFSSNDQDFPFLLINWE